MNLKTSLRRKEALETLNDLLPLLKSYGITRLARLDRLDDMSLPVYTAIRPLAKSITTSQGKALDLVEAKVSALMESIEVYYAENVLPDLIDKSISELDKNTAKCIPTDTLNYPEEYRMNWVKAQTYSGEMCLIPWQCVSLDTTSELVRLDQASSTGLASGNDDSEALLHSLYEIIEKQSINSDRMEILGILETLPKDIRERFYIKFFLLKNKYDVPVIECQMQSKNPFDNQTVFLGYGAHLMVSIAFNRAYTEAIQSRVTNISASRDDINKAAYTYKNEGITESASTVNYMELCSIKKEHISEHIPIILDKVSRENQCVILYKYTNKEFCVLKSFLVSEDVPQKGLV